MSAMRSLRLALAAVATLAPASVPPGKADAPDTAGKALAAAFASLCLDTALSLDRVRAAWPVMAKNGAQLGERPIDAVTPDPQARPGAPKPSGPPAAEPRVRLDGRLELDGATYDLAAVAPKGADRLDACRIEASLADIDAGHDAVVATLGLTEPKVIAASQSSTYLNDPDPTIFKYVQYRGAGPGTVTIGLELKPHGRGNLLLIAEPPRGD
ncbi:MAG: hypothetical protein V9G18_00395 [Albidovulum sp.]